MAHEVYFNAHWKRKCSDSSVISDGNSAKSKQREKKKIKTKSQTQ